METKQILIGLVVGFLVLAFARLIFAPYPEKQRDVIFTENIHSEEMVNDPGLRTQLNDAASVYIPLQKFDSQN